MKQWFSELFVNTVVVAKVMLVVAVPTSLLVVHVWNQFRVAQMGYEIAEATSEHEQLLEEQKKLTVEARLQGRSDRVSEMARQQFDLRVPEPDQFVTVGESPEEASGEHAHAETTGPEETPSAVH